MSIRQIIAVSAVAGLAACASANTVNMKYLGTSLGRNVKVTLSGNSSDVFAGQLRHQFSGGTGALGSQLNGLQTTFCTDLSQFVNTNFQSYSVVGVESVPNPGTAIGLTKANMIRDLYGSANGSQFATTSNNANNDFAAAFQMAIWSIVYNGTVTLSGPTLTIKNTNGTAITGSLLTAFNNIATYVGSGLRNGGDVYGVTSGSFQDQLVLLPMPAPALAAGAGLLAVAGFRRRR